MQTPYYAIRVDKEDISNFVTSFTYEDSVNEDDLLKINLQGVSIDIINSEILKVGKEISFQFGYLGGLVSALHLARIADIDFNYGKTIDVNINALDLGQLMKKNQSTEVFIKKTASDIVTQIAKKYGLRTKNIEKTSLVYPHLPQANRTDWQLIAYLAEREKDGSFRYYIKDNELFFGRLILEQEVKVTLNYNNPNKNIISFKPTLKDSQNSTYSSETTISNYNPIDKKVNKIIANTETAKDNVLLGKESNASSDKRTKERIEIKYDAYGKPKK